MLFVESISSPTNLSSLPPGEVSTPGIEPGTSFTPSCAVTDAEAEQEEGYSYDAATRGWVCDDTLQLMRTYLALVEAATAVMTHFALTVRSAQFSFVIPKSLRSCLQSPQSGELGIHSLFAAWIQAARILGLSLKLCRPGVGQEVK